MPPRLPGLDAATYPHSVSKAVDTDLVDRYVKRTLVSSAGSIELWLGEDPSLERSVGIRLIPLDHPRAHAAAVAARSAGAVTERRLIAVLDVLTGPPGARDCLAIITEWVPGRTLGDLLEDRDGDAFGYADALALTRQVALAIATSHAQGVTHGRLRPGSLLLSDSVGGALHPDPWDLDAYDVRVRGLAVDAALWGGSLSDVTHPGDPDVHGLGCLLYSAITGRWPEGLVDGMSAAPRVNGRLLPPSQVVAEVSPTLDDLCRRSIHPAVWHTDPQAAPLPDAFGSIDAMVDALAAAADRAATDRMRRSLVGVRASSRTPAQRRGRGRRAAVRSVAVLGAAAAIVLLGSLGWRVIADSPSPWGVAAQSVPTDVLTAVPEEPTTPGLVDSESGLLPGQIPPVSVMSYDPFGPDREEFPELVDLAVDADPTTAWTTETYYSPTFGNKEGVGIIIDLGTAQAISEVSLDLVGTGSSIEVKVGSDPSARPNRWVPFADASAIGSQIDLRVPRPLVGRFVLVWFTQLPPSEDGYMGGIRNVAVFT